MQTWLLPEKIADVLPSEARKIEELRRLLLDQFRLYGYELVIPPLIEYVDSLLNGSGQDSELRMFKFVDQISGRSLAIRSDMTTQVARIDAHLLNRKSVTRLCYAGSVLQTYPYGLFTTREPFQIGAEIYGHAGLEADAEIHQLIISSLLLVQNSEIYLDFCHVNVLRALLKKDGVAQRYEAKLFKLLAEKNLSELALLSQNFHPQTCNALLKLPELYGDVSVLARARSELPDFPEIQQALNELEQVIALIPSNSSIKVSIDLSDLRGYHYHSGVMFAIYIPGLPNAIVRGGRYDHVGASFGRARPATGFSLDLRELARIMPAAKRKPAILAPWQHEKRLEQKILELRKQGEIVIQMLPGHKQDHEEFECNRVLILSDEVNPQWIIQELEK